jgi:uncharacterized protein
MSPWCQAKKRSTSASSLPHPVRPVGGVPSRGRAQPALRPGRLPGVADLVGPGGHVWDHLVVMRRMPAPGGSPPGGGRCRPRRRAGTRRPPGPPGGRLTPSASAQDPDVVDADECGASTPWRPATWRGRKGCSTSGSGPAGPWPGAATCRPNDIFLLPDGPCVVDCLEFDDDLRRGNALADVGFLAMDPKGLGRSDLPGRFLACLP